MDVWAGSSLGQQAQFVCVCVADGGGVDLALEFGRSLKLRHCVNGVILDRSQMPSWGQLGCNGLIVLDENLVVVTPASKPFLEVGQAAFKDVEDILKGILKSTSVEREGAEVDGSVTSKRPKVHANPIYQPATFYFLLYQLFNPQLCEPSVFYLYFRHFSQSWILQVVR
jgi:hypothetical protein